MPADPLLFVAGPFVVHGLWAVYAFFRTPSRFSSILAPVFLQLASVFFLGKYVYDKGVYTLELDVIGLPAGTVLAVDGLGVLLSGVTALVMSACAIYALGYFRIHRIRQTKTLARERFFWPLLALLWSGLLLVWISADLLTTYVAMEVVGLSAAAMMVLPDKARAVQAGLRYLFLMLTGSLCYLLGAGIVYGMYGSIDFAGIADAARPGGDFYVAMALASAGLMLKAAVFPMHAWLPIAHSHAWSPISAIHAALVVKASFFVFVKLWMAILPEAEAASQLIGLAGGAAVVWGSLMALSRQEIKHIVAYSTMAQLGYLLLVFPLIASAADSSAARLAWQGTWLLFISHAFAKAAMFLAVGNLVLAMGRADLNGFAGVDCYLPVSLLVFGLASLNIIGLPICGGFTAKWLLLNSAMASGQWHWVALLSAGTLLGAAYVFRIFKYALVSGAQTDCYMHLPTGKETVAFVLAFAAVLLGLFAKWPLALIDIGGGPLP